MWFAILCAEGRFGLIQSLQNLVILALQVPRKSDLALETGPGQRVARIGLLKGTLVGQPGLLRLAKLRCVAQ